MKIFQSNPSRLALSLVLMVAAVIMFFFWNNITACVIASLVLQAFALFITIYCLYKEKNGPFEITAVGLTFIFFTLSLLSAVSESVNVRIYSVIDYVFLTEWDWVALIVALASLVFAACTWISQERTQKNTTQVSPDSQLAMLEDLIRDIYRNISIVYALDAAMQGRFSTHYPAEEILLRLQTDDRNIIPTVFADGNEKCRTLQHLRINLRNANIDYTAISERMRDGSLPPEVHQDDIKAVKERIETTINRIRKAIKEIWGYDEHIASELLAYIKETAADNNDNNEPYRTLFAEAARKFESGELPYFYPGIDADGRRTDFLKLRFPDPDEAPAELTAEEKAFVLKLNQNIYADLHRPGRIRLIPFVNKQ